jgi:hypothetical protein
MQKQIYILLIVVLGFSSCIKRDEFPDEPIIKYIDFRQTPDTAYLRFSFTDGDGDLGLDQGDTLNPFEHNGPNYFNIYVKYFEFKNGAFEELVLPAPFNYRFARIKSPSKNNSLEGEMKIKIPSPYRNPLIAKGDTVRYDFYIMDRALHKSNEASTGAVVIQY